MTNRPTAENLIHTYFRAKDGNRPHLMAQVFAEDARLEMQVNSDAIAFPAVTQGLAAITDVLVRKFGQVYENVYSFALQRPSSDISAEHFSCDWMVVMSEKESRNVRVGCGRYDWKFQTGEPFLVEQLHITIEAMQVFPPDPIETTLAWAAQLPYPWCTSQVIVKTAPYLPGFEPILRYLKRD